jgi:hypothetical protein
MDKAIVTPRMMPVISASATIAMSLFFTMIGTARTPFWRLGFLWSLYYQAGRSFVAAPRLMAGRPRSGATAHAIDLTDTVFHPHAFRHLSIQWARDGSAWRP